MENSDIVKTGMKSWEKNDEATLASLLDDDFQFSGPVPQPLNAQGFIGFMHTILAAMPNFAFNASGFEESGDTILVKTYITGTHTGTLILPGMPEIPATNIQVCMPEERQMYTLKNGKIYRLDIESGPEGGVPGLLKQIGVALPQ